MASGEVISTVKVVPGINADAISGAVNGPEFDTAGWDEAIIVLNAGVIAATGTLDCKVQESDTSGSGHADITGAAFTQVVTAGDESIAIGRLKLGSSRGRKRYMRLVMTQAVAGADGGAIVILCQPQTPSLASNEGGYQNLDFDKQ
jgi:hypothetical protein